MYALLITINESQMLLPKFINEGRERTNQYEISMHFNNYFSTVGEQLLQQSKNKIQNKVPPSAFYDNSVKNSIDRKSVV